MTRRRDPDGLQRAGAALRDAVLGQYDLAPHERVALIVACRQADDVARLEALLADGGMVVPGSAGQPRLSAVVGELRQGRLALAKLLSELRLPSEQGEARPASPASDRARKAAERRWSLENQRREAAGLPPRGA